MSIYNRTVSEGCSVTEDHVTMNDDCSAVASDANGFIPVDDVPSSRFARDSSVCVTEGSDSNNCCLTGLACMNGFDVTRSSSDCVDTAACKPVCSMALVPMATERSLLPFSVTSKTSLPSGARAHARTSSPRSVHGDEYCNRVRDKHHKSSKKQLHLIDIRSGMSSSMLDDSSSSSVISSGTISSFSGSSTSSGSSSSCSSKYLDMLSTDGHSTHYNIYEDYVKQKYKECYPMRGMPSKSLPAGVRLCPTCHRPFDLKDFLRDDELVSTYSNKRQSSSGDSGRGRLLESAFVQNDGLEYVDSRSSKNYDRSNHDTRIAGDHDAEMMVHRVQVGPTYGKISSDRHLYTSCKDQRRCEDDSDSSPARDSSGAYTDGHGKKHFMNSNQKFNFSYVDESHTQHFPINHPRWHIEAEKSGAQRVGKQRVGYGHCCHDHRHPRIRRYTRHRRHHRCHPHERHGYRTAVTLPALMLNPAYFSALARGMPLAIEDRHEQEQQQKRKQKRLAIYTVMQSPRTAALIESDRVNGEACEGGKATVSAHDEHKDCIANNRSTNDYSNMDSVVDLVEGNSIHVHPAPQKSCNILHRRPRGTNAATSPVAAAAVPAAAPTVLKLPLLTSSQSSASTSSAAQNVPDVQPAHSQSELDANHSQLLLISSPPAPAIIALSSSSSNRSAYTYVSPTRVRTREGSDRASRHGSVVFAQHDQQQQKAHEDATRLTKQSDDSRKTETAVTLVPGAVRTGLKDRPTPKLLREVVAASIESGPVDGKIDSDDTKKISPVKSDHGNNTVEHKHRNGKNNNNSASAANGLHPLTPPSDPHAPELPSDHAGSECVAYGFYNQFFVELRALGRGSFGGVYLCEHVMAGVPLGRFAVKKIPVGDNTAYLQNVLHEVRILQTVRRHPNVVEYNHSWVEEAQIADFGPPVRCLFVLMEYASKGSLDVYLQLHGTALSTPVVWYFFLSAVAGTAHMHRKNILHRDLKPQNLLLTGPTDEPPRVLVSDFGTAAALSENSYERTGGTGTLEYMAPELLVIRRDVCPDELPEREREGHGERVGKGPRNEGAGSNDNTSASTTHDGTATRDCANDNSEDVDVHNNIRADHVPPSDLAASATAATPCASQHVHYSCRPSTASDVWSLGMILHYLAYNATLPPRRSDGSVDLQLHNRSNHTVLSSAPVAATAASFISRPPEMTQLISAMLQRDPRKRPSCHDILNSTVAQAIIQNFHRSDAFSTDFLTSMNALHLHRPLSCQARVLSGCPKCRTSSSSPSHQCSDVNDAEEAKRRHRVDEDGETVADYDAGDYDVMHAKEPAALVQSHPYSRPTARTPLLLQYDASTNRTGSVALKRHTKENVVEASEEINGSMTVSSPPRRRRRRGAVSRQRRVRLVDACVQTEG